MIRLQKYLSLCGVSSRRNAEKIILEGRVKIDGNKVYNLGIKINETKSKVWVDDRQLKLEGKVYIMLNKPVGYISSVKDEKNRPTVMDLVSDIKTRIYPVGRLDYYTEGMLIMTNDGDFTNKLTHPKHEVDKVYIAEISGNLSLEMLSKLRSGIVLDGYKTSPAKINVLGSSKFGIKLEITIHEGRKRQIREMFLAVGVKVKKLKRICEGGVLLGNLPSGKWRKLNPSELKILNNL